ncbi:MAG: hypothetical protein GWP19_07105 [Planctomycetia bacterium]|nr:hypothetical protein [Planctomycetia bacterium]
MNKKILIFVFGLFFISLVGATNIGTFKQGQQMQITNFCFTANCSYANLTIIISPNGTINYVNSPMTKNGQNFNYSYVPNVSGTYRFNTCSDPGGVEFCDSDSFTITPSGRSGSSNIVFFSLIISLLYILTFLSFFNRIESLTILSGMALGVFGLYMIRNGIIIYRDWFTNYVSYVTIAVGFILAIWAGIEWIQNNL